MNVKGVMSRIPFVVPGRYDLKGGGVDETMSESFLSWTIARSGDGTGPSSYDLSYLESSLY